MNMKYNVGDRVVDKSDLTMLFNPFWKKEKRMRLMQIVTEANEKLFTVYNNKGHYKSTLENALSCGAHEYLAYHQNSGNCYSWSDQTRLLHLEHDKEEIREIMESDGAKHYNEDVDRHERTIALHKTSLEQTHETYAEDLQINRELLGL